MSGILGAIDISSKGLTVQRSKMDTTARNIANAETTRTEEGGPYRRRRVVVSETQEQTSFSKMVKQAGTRMRRTNPKHLGGRSVELRQDVEASAVTQEEMIDPASNFRVVHDPTHPDADAEGYVKYPDIEIVTEMVDMMAAARAYEANTVAIAAAKQMAKSALDI
ncbi:MAG: flagellar basal body rod protein FlgC [candidate division Zixibacteria bacterium]|nr:flagellar basal body rod protein FlgC [candidate division Zixibacteria bacterium]